MNEGRSAGQAAELKGLVKEQWGTLTDDDLEMIEGQAERLVGLLRRRYGFAKEKAEQEYRPVMEHGLGNGGGLDKGHPRPDGDHEKT